MKRIAFSAAIVLSAVALGSFGIWVTLLPPEVPTAPKVPQEAETSALLDSLRQASSRPVIAVIGINDATETTDYLMPTGILRRADIADVQLLAPADAPVKLYPALQVEPDATPAEFDARYPDGADYVIVPAMSRDDDPTIMAWLKAQAEKGSIIIGVCAGAKVVAAAGLLDGRKATTHWFYRNELLRENKSISYVADRRFVLDGNIMTTTGISASMPLALALVEAIAGHDKAAEVAAEIGVASWDSRHDSAAFLLTRPFATTVLGNFIRFWAKEQFELQLDSPYDAVSLALLADAWSRTFRSEVTTVAATSRAVPDSTGIRIIPDRVTYQAHDATTLAAPGQLAPAEVLDATLAGIEARYGTPTAKVVAMQLEYPWKGADAPTANVR